MNLKSGPGGTIDLEDLRSKMNETVAGIMITNPNTLGLFESDIEEVVSIVHGAGGLLYMDGANLNALLGIVKPGEIGEAAYRGPSFGAWRNPEYNKEAYDEEGWQWEGDYATWDEEGNITWVGRPENVIMEAGKMISPMDIESTLFYNPKVAQVVAAPIPAKGKKAGNEFCLYVVPRPGETISLEEAREFLKENGIEEFALPERLEILEKMPLTPAGKVNYTELKKMVE